MLVDEKWLERHQGQYADWHPRIEIVRPGSKQTFTIKSKDAENAVIKTMRENKKKGGK